MCSSTSDISILPSLFLSNFCMNSVIFSLKAAFEGSCMEKAQQDESSSHSLLIGKALLGLYFSGQEKAITLKVMYTVHCLVPYSLPLVWRIIALLTLWDHLWGSLRFIVEHTGMKIKSPFLSFLHAICLVICALYILDSHMDQTQWK